MPGIKMLPVKNKSATAQRVTSLTVIGIVATAVIEGFSTELKLRLTSDSNMLRFNDVDEALKVFEKVKGTAREELYDIKQQNVMSPIVLSVVPLTTAKADKKPSTFYDDTKIKTAVIKAIDTLQLARTMYGSDSKVRIAIAGWFSHDTAVADALNTFAVKTKTISICDLHETSINGALVKLNKLGSQRQMTFPFYRKAYSIYESATIEKPNSALVAGHIAYWDAKLGEFGFAFDHANRPVNNVEGATVTLTYEEGEETCGVNVIVNAGGAVLLNDDGWKLYNFETTADDERFNKVETVRFFDGYSENLQKALKKHKHRPVTDVFTLAKADADAWAGKVVGSGAAIGSKVVWSDRNTASEVASGTVYMDYDAGNNVGVRTIIVQPYATNEYYANLIADNK